MMAAQETILYGVSNESSPVGPSRLTQHDGEGSIIIIQQQFLKSDSGDDDTLIVSTCIYRAKLYLESWLNDLGSQVKVRQSTTTIRVHHCNA